MGNNKNDGFHTYTVTFDYKQGSYTCSFCSTAELNPQTPVLVAWGLADDAIKECMKSIPDREKGVYPHNIVIKGEFGPIKVKD